METLRALGLGCLLLTVALAGCFGDDEVQPVRSVSATGGLASDGYDYDATTLTGASASLEGWVHDPDNTGSLEASFEYAGSTWTVTYDQFSGEEPWKDGGVEFGLPEHGDTGTSSTIIPAIDGRVITYGSAQVTRDGQPYAIGESSGSWSAHLMVNAVSVRGPDGRITQADGSAPYNPDDPANARIIQDDPQAMLQLIAPSGEDSARAPVTVNESLAIQGPDQTQTLPLPTSRYSSASINLTAHGGDVPIGAGNVHVRILNETGGAVDSASGEVVANQPFEASFQVDNAMGPLTVEVSGNGTYTADVSATVSYDDHPFIVLTWNDYTLEELDTAPAGAGANGESA